MINTESQATSTEQYARAMKVIPGGVNSPVRAFKYVGGEPFFVKSSEGGTLTTSEDQVLIDFVGTWGPAIHGHNNPYIKSKIAEALEKGTSFGTPNEYEVPLAEKIVQMVPSIEKVRMTSSGTEATMTAIRLARGYTGRDKIVKFTGCYHGHVDSLLVKAGSGALTLGNPDSAGVPSAFAEQTIVLNYNDKAGIKKLFAERGDEIAGLIVEPYPANCGLILPNPGYLELLRELCTQNKSVLIFDEVMTGFRLAFGSVQEISGVTPDMTTLGKIIGGGLPVGAFGGKTEIMDCLAPLGPVYQAGTLSGNPLAMAAGYAALELLEQNPPYDYLNQLGDQLAQALRDKAAAIGLALQVHQTGSMLSMFFTEERVVDFDGVMNSKMDYFKPLFQYALEHGVFLPPSPYETAFISTAHTPEMIETSARVLGEGLEYALKTVGQ